MLRRALGIALIASWPAIAAAQSSRVSLNWDHCVGAGVQTDQTFDCSNPEAFYRLVIELKPPNFANFFGADIAIDVGKTGATALNPFWHYEDAGCNSTGLTFSVNRSLLGAGTVGCAPTITGTGGSQASGLITAYGPGYGGANRARLLMTVARPNSSPIQLVDGTDYYLGHLTFSMENSCSGTERTCYGCRDQVSLAFTCGVTLFSTTSQPIIVGDFSCTTVVTANGGPPECELPGGMIPCLGPKEIGDAEPTSSASPENDCSKEVTAVKGRTWGAIKSLYR